MNPPDPAPAPRGDSPPPSADSPSAASSTSSPSPAPVDATDDYRVSPLRILANIGAVIVASVTLAPFGVFFALGRMDDLNEIVRGVFWLGFLLLAGLGALLPGKRDRGSVLGATLTMIVLATALLNLGGCLAILQGFGRATG